ncbi:MAG: efflux RND transporter permease subunit, partial [Candidatus Omnitrophica bacterium]|nr:efflux RND transporter permease subunit [Candidatus Omnitrophota bacterium]
MKLSEFSVKNSLLINLISVLILILGFYTVFIEKIRREAFPEVSYDSVIVTTVYPGASPEEIEKLVTVPLEKEIKAVDGLERFQSKSLENTSTIMVEISQDVKDKSKVIDDIGNAVDRVTDLPQDAEEPFVLEITSGEIPVVQVALSGNLDEFKLQDLAEDLEDVLENIEGVSSISRRGWRDKQVNIAVDPKKMQDYRVSFTEIISALSKKNVSIPGGKLRSDSEFNIRTTGEFTGLEEISNVIIRANDFGNWLKVKDVASVEYAFEDETVLTKSQGTRSIILTVLKRPSADAISLVNRV